MAFLRMTCKAKKIDRLKKDLFQEKRNAIKSSYGLTPKYSARQKYQHFCIDLKASLKDCLTRTFSFPERTCLHRTCYNLRHDGTCENFTVKSVVGFVAGFLLTYIFFMFFVFQLNFKLGTATVMCALFGSILTIGLAFSYKVRCVVLLLLPQFFSKKGRQALLAYAFILAITGPAKNTLNNMGILSESLACGQEQLKAAVRQIIDVIKKPFYAIRDAIKAVVKTVKVIVKKIKEILLTIKRLILALLKVIKSAFQFLAKIINICNKELGTPFQRCQRVFENAITDCNAKLGPLFSWLCSITYLVKAVCYIVKIFDFVCMIVDFVSDSIVGVVARKIKIFVRHVRTMFYVRIKFSHSFHFETNQSKSMSDITAGVVTEIKQRTEKILAFFDFMSCATSLFFLFIILRVVYYRYKFLTNERFDNRFITRDFRNVDLKRAQLGREAVLPLNHRERKLYITVTSMRLVDAEKHKLSKAFVVLGMATLKLSTHMMADYALYWVLTMIRYHAKFQSSVPAPNVPEVHIEGTGLLADLLRSIVKAFQPLGIKLEIDTVPCLPDPIPPDYDRYVQIVSSLILCWILTIFEPYGLRLRHSVMCYYHPTRAKQRAVWLYNHIMRSRSSFLKFARRQLRRKVTGSKGIAKITFKEYLRANIRCNWLRCCLGPDKQDCCLLCGEVFRESDQVKPIRCQKPNCPGIYCEQCFADLQNLCTVCMEPMEYGDISDISEEKDSSEEEIPTPRKRQKKKKRVPIENSRDDDSDDDDDEGRFTKPRREDDDSSRRGFDSDYYTSGNSTDYSYGYQNKKNITQFAAPHPRSPFLDPEKQRIPNYASMNSGASDNEDSSTSDLEHVSPRTTISSSQLSSSQKSANLRKLPTKRKFKVPMIEDGLPLLPLDASYSDISDQSDSSISYQKKLSSDTETTFIETPRTAYQYSVSTDNGGRSFAETGVGSSDVPKLDLNFDSKDEDDGRSPTFTARFKNVRYEIVRESPSSQSTTDTFASSNSSYQPVRYENDARTNTDSKSVQSELPTKRQKYTFASTDTTNSPDALKGQEKLRRRTREYYRKLKVEPNVKIRKSPSKLIRFLSSLFGKESRGGSDDTSSDISWK